MIQLTPMNQFIKIGLYSFSHLRIQYLQVELWCVEFKSSINPEK